MTQASLRSSAQDEQEPRHVFCTNSREPATGEPDKSALKLQEDGPPVLLHTTLSNP